MSNLFDALDNSTAFSKFKVDDLLFVEYTCDPGGPRAEIWSHTNYFTYVVTGKMTLKTPDKSYEIRAGEAYFIPKGSFIIPQFFEEVFCDIIVFIPDQFICEVIRKYELTLPTPVTGYDIQAVIPLHLDPSLIQYYRSLFTFFKGPKPPSKVLLKLKFEELIVNVLTQIHNQDLVAYFYQLQHNRCPDLREIMENNFNANLTLSEFARMCARSLSTFRRDFESEYHTSPGSWLREKRLHFSCQLLMTTTQTIDDIAYESGFGNRTHFSRCFKERFGSSPHQFRLSRGRLR